MVEKKTARGAKRERKNMEVKGKNDRKNASPTGIASTKKKKKKTKTPTPRLGKRESPLDLTKGTKEAEHHSAATQKGGATREEGGGSTNKLNPNREKNGQSGSKS